MAGKFWCAYHSWMPAMSALSDAECGRLFRCALKYSATGEETDLPGNERFAWSLIKPQIDMDNAKYNGKIDNLRKAGRTSADKRQQMSTNVSKCSKEKEKENEVEKEKENENVSKAKARAFTPPTLDEIRTYCTERGNRVDPERFLDYYTANGWRVGKNPMKDWKAAVRTWERSDHDKGRNPDDGGKTAEEWGIHYTF